MGGTLTLQDDPVVSRSVSSMTVAFAELIYIMRPLVWRKATWSALFNGVSCSEFSLARFLEAMVFVFGCGLTQQSVDKHTEA